MTTFTRYPPTATTPTRRNRITNPRMAVGSTTGWANGTNAGSLAWSGSAAGGVSSGRFTTTGSAVAVVETIVTASPGDVLSFRGQVQPFTTARTGLLRIYFLDAAMSVIGSNTDATASAPLGVLTDLVINNLTAPAGTAYVRYLIGINNSAGAGQAINWTRTMVVNGTTPGTYMDGDTTSTYPTFYYWEGVEQLSASREVTVTGGADQLTTPLIGVTAPYTVSRESRNVARPLLESSEVRGVLVPPGPRKGEIQSVYETPTQAMDALTFFSAQAVYYIIDEAYATFWFTIADGAATFEQPEAGAGLIRLPYVEVPAP